MAKTKKQKIIEIVKEKPFVDLPVLADDLNTNVEYIKEVLRDEEINKELLKLEKFIDLKMKYRNLSEKYTEIVIENAILDSKEDMLEELFGLQKEMQERINYDSLPEMQPKRIPMTVTSIIG